MPQKKRKKQKYYVVVEENSKKDCPFIQGAFPMTEEGRQLAGLYAKKLSKQHDTKYVIREG